MKTLLKFVVGLAVVAAVAGAVVVFWPQITGHTIAGSAVSAVTGSSSAASLVDKVASGTDLTDSEIEKALGIDSATYKKLKSAAASAGIDLNDSSQLQSLVQAASGHASELQSLVSELESGALSETEAANRLSDLLGVSKAS